MILPLLILAVQASTAPAVPRPPPGSGLELMSQCVAAAGMILGPASANGEQVEKGALCLGCVEGFIDGAKRGLCLPPHSVTVVISSYLTYMKDKPKYYESPKAEGLRAFLDATYPCKK